MTTLDTSTPSRIQWRVLDPERADRLAARSPEDAERVRLVDVLCSQHPNVDPEDLLVATLEQLRAIADGSGVVKRRRLRSFTAARDAAAKREKRGRRPERLPDAGEVLTDDWRLVDGVLHRRERWRSWVGEVEELTERWVPKTAQRTEWKGKAMRTETIVYALLHPERVLPGGLIPRGRRPLGVAKVEKRSGATTKIQARIPSHLAPVFSRVRESGALVQWLESQVIDLPDWLR